MKLRATETSLVAIFAALTALGANISIPLPFTSVPITLQTFFTYLAALLLGGRLAALSQALYILLGISGLPVFAGGKSGLGVIVGPTGGYILGFLVGAYTAGKITEVKINFIRCLTALLVATSTIYGAGILQLWIVMNTLYGGHLSFLEAAFMGVVPFILGDIAKAIIAVNLIRSRRILALRNRVRTNSSAMSFEMKTQNH